MARIDRSPPAETPGGIRLHSSIKPNIGTIKVPNISAELIEYLDQVFSDRIKPEWDHFDFKQAIGRREVVDHLIGLFRDQENPPTHVPE